MNQSICLTESCMPDSWEIDRLESHVKDRLSGRIRSLRLLLREEGLILAGSAPSYYVKQLAQHAVMQASEYPIAANQIEVC
jgi:hypothetical protein